MGPFPPHYSDEERELPLTVFEEIVVLLLNISSMFAWTLIFGGLLAALTQSDPDKVAYQIDLDRLNLFCERYRLSTELKREVRRYFFQTLTLNYAASRAEALKKLSPALAEKITYTVNKGWLMQLPFYKHMENGEMMKMKNGNEDYHQSQTNSFLTKMVMAMKPAVYAPKEIPPMPRLYVITAGSVLYQSDSGKKEKGQKKRYKTLGVGNCWGAEDVLSLRFSALRAVAATFLHVQWIGPNELRALRKEYKAQFRRLRFWAILQDVGSHLIELLHEMPAALKKDDEEKSILLRPLSDALPPASTDSMRAELVVGEEVRKVRFREKDLKALWRKNTGEDDNGLKAMAWLQEKGKMEVVSVEDKVGGMIVLKDGQKLPNPRLLVYKEEQRPSLKTSKIIWTDAMVRDEPDDSLWKLKKAIDESIEDRMKRMQDTERKMQRKLALKQKELESEKLTA